MTTYVISFLFLIFSDGLYAEKIEPSIFWERDIPLEFDNSGSFSLEGMSVSSLENIYLLGWWEGAWVEKVAPSGDPVWRIQPDYFPNAGISYQEDNLLLTQYKRQRHGLFDLKPGSDFYISALDNDGKQEWRRQYGDHSHELGKSIITIGDRIVLLGFSSDTNKIFIFEENGKKLREITIQYSSRNGKLVSIDDQKFAVVIPEKDRHDSSANSLIAIIFDIQGEHITTFPMDRVSLSSAFYHWEFDTFFQENYIFLASQTTQMGRSHLALSKYAISGERIWTKEAAYSEDGHVNWTNAELSRQPTEMRAVQNFSIVAGDAGEIALLHSHNLKLWASTFKSDGTAFVREIALPDCSLLLRGLYAERRERKVYFSGAGFIASDLEGSVTPESYYENRGNSCVFVGSINSDEIFK